MGSLNKTLLIGRLGQDPQISFMPSGKAVANFTMATSETWNDKDTGEKKEKTEWHKIVFFDRKAEIVEKYISKGSQVYIEGKLQTREWEDKDGNRRFTTEIVGQNIQMLDSKGGSAADGGPPEDDGSTIPF